MWLYNLLSYFVPFSTYGQGLEMREIVMENEVIKKWIDDKPLKKLIYVKNKMVNVVV
jgi:leucyl-tRNA synthetase